MNVRNAHKDVYIRGDAIDENVKETNLLDDVAFKKVSFTVCRTDTSVKNNELC